MGNQNAVPPVRRVLVRIDHIRVVGGVYIINHEWRSPSPVTNAGDLVVLRVDPGGNILTMTSPDTQTVVVLVDSAGFFEDGCEIRIMSGGFDNIVYFAVNTGHLEMCKKYKIVFTPTDDGGGTAMLECEQVDDGTPVAPGVRLW